MKFADLKALAHNLADSAACGMGFLIGVYQMDIFGEAKAAPEGYIEVDFLTGSTRGGTPSAALARALALYAKEGLPKLLQVHDASLSDIRELRARFWGVASQRVELTVEDHRGRRASSEYQGLPLRRVKVLDHLDRVRAG